MRLAVIEQHIFGCRRRIAETIADIEAEAASVCEYRLSRTPVPGIIVSPDTASPVQSRQSAVLRPEPVFPAAQCNDSVGAQAVDFLVVIKMVFLRKRRSNDH